MRRKDREIKMLNLQMLFRLNCYQFKIWYYKFKDIYVNLMVITRENIVVIIQKNTIKLKHTGTRRHQNKNILILNVILSDF